MKFEFKELWLLLGLVVGRFAKASQIWETTITGTVTEGNGVYLSPSGESLLVADTDGRVTSLDAETGSLLWEYEASLMSNFVRKSSGGISFTSPGAPSPYMVFSFVEEIGDSIEQGYVVALDMDGNELWISAPILGEAVGSPKISSDGENIFLNFNVAHSFGRFVILSSSFNGAIVHNQVIGDCPIAPLGIFHNPAEGYFTGGELNTNDLVMWSCTARDPFLGFGGIYVFQFPPVGAGPLSFTFLGDTPGDFWGIAPPMITNEGRSAYWGSSSSRYFAWVGAAGLARYQFDRSPTAVVSFPRAPGFVRQPVHDSFALSSDPFEPIIYGGTAALQFVRLSHDFSDQTSVSTASVVVSRAVVSPMDDKVYYAESNGMIHQADAFDLVDISIVDTGGVPILGEMALDSTGEMLFAADVFGTVRSFFVGAPSEMPSELPSKSPSSSPSFVSESPSSSPSEVPSETPSSSPSEAPSETSSSSPSELPSESPSSSPSELPSEIPSSLPSPLPSTNPTELPEPLFIGFLTTRSHNVSGAVYVVTEQILEIRNFFFDGQAPAAYFWIDSNPFPTAGGNFLADASPSFGCARNASDPELGVALGITQRVELPNGSSILDYVGGSIGIWCYAFSVNFGELIIPPITSSDIPRLNEFPECFEAPSAAPTARCRDVLESCTSASDCCSNKCNIFAGVCVSQAPPGKTKRGEGRGGAAGRTRGG